MACVLFSKPIRERSECCLIADYPHLPSPSSATWAERESKEEQEQKSESKGGSRGRRVGKIERSLPYVGLELLGVTGASLTLPIMNPTSTSPPPKLLSNKSWHQ